MTGPEQLARALEHLGATLPAAQYPLPLDGAADLRQLVEHSASVGALDLAYLWPTSPSWAMSTVLCRRRSGGRPRRGRPAPGMSRVGASPTAGGSG